MPSISHQMKSARFPLHRDLAGFDFAASPVDKALITKLADLSFTEDAHNVVLIGGPGTGKTHLATALRVAQNSMKNPVQNSVEINNDTTLIDVRVAGEAVWLNQNQIALCSERDA